MKRRRTPEETALARALSEHAAAKRAAVALIDEGSASGDDLAAASAEVRATRVALRVAGLAIESAHRRADRRACLESAVILERARDVADWQERAAAFRAHAADHDARLTALADPIAAAIADDAAPRPVVPVTPPRR